MLSAEKGGGKRATTAKVEDRIARSTRLMHSATDKSKHKASTPPDSSRLCVSSRQPYVTRWAIVYAWRAVQLSCAFCALIITASHGLRSLSSPESTLPRIAPDAPGAAAGAEEPAVAGRSAVQSTTAATTPSPELRARQHRDAAQQRPQMGRPWRLLSPCPSAPCRGAE